MKNFFKSKGLWATGVLVVVFVLAFILFYFFWPTTRQREKGAYEIARDNSWYPLDLLGKEQNMVGFSNELLQKISKETEFHYEIFNVGQNVSLESLDRRRFDAVFSSLAPNVITEKTYAFSDPIYLLGPVLIVKKDSDISALENMQGKILGIPSITTQSFIIRDNPDVLIVPYDNVILALEDLDKNVIDGVVVDALMAYAYTKGFYKEKLKVVSSPLTDKGIRLVALKDPRSLRLISKFNEGLRSLRKNGTYEKLLQKWGLIRMSGESPES